MRDPDLASFFTPSILPTLWLDQNCLMSEMFSSGTDPDFPVMFGAVSHVQNSPLISSCLRPQGKLRKYKAPPVPYQLWSRYESSTVTCNISVQCTINSVLSGNREKEKQSRLIINSLMYKIILLMWLCLFPSTEQARNLLDGSCLGRGSGARSSADANRLSSILCSFRI